MATVISAGSSPRAASFYSSEDVIPVGVPSQEMADLHTQLAELRSAFRGLEGRAVSSGAATTHLHQKMNQVEGTVERMSGFINSVQNAYNTATHVKASVVETVAQLGSKLADMVAGFTAISAKGSPAPFDHVSRGFLAVRGCSDLASLLPAFKGVASAAGETLLEPTFDSVAELGKRVADISQISTRIGYLAAVLGMITFPPFLHAVNIIATGASGALACVGSMGKYHTCLLMKRSGEVEARKGQITALFEIAANVSLIAFAVLSLQAASLSMLPLTVGTGIALALSAGFSIMAKLNERLSADGSSIVFGDSFAAVKA